MSAGEVHQRLDNIRTILSSFRMEQEQLILKSADDQRFRSSKSSIAPPITPSDAANEEVYLSRILNIESVIMPVGNSASAGQKLWPQAILSARYGDLARMGNIETNGSLWKVVPRKDGAIGTRVVLQSAEIGDEPLYLNPNLQLVQNKVDAAVWNLRASAQPMDIIVSTGADSLPSMDSKNIAKGINVQFELVDPRLAQDMHMLSQFDFSKRDSRTLVLSCRYSPLKATTELCTVSYDTLALQQLRDVSETDPTEMHYSIIWEVCPESWISDELDFLDRYLN